MRNLSPKRLTPAVAEIMAVGNELLNGSVQDGNSFWLIQKIMDLGGMVGKVTILPDDKGIIAEEVRLTVNRVSGKPPAFLFLTGGLGPTEDDLTVAAVAEGLGLSLFLDIQAREMIRRSYDALAANGVIAQGGLNPPREKMALLPEGATALSNPVGTAPGVLVRQNQTAIVCFPGVPPEMQAIFQTSLHPFMVNAFPAVNHARSRLRIHSNDESFLAPYLRRFADHYPAIHVKALSGIIAENPQLEFIFSVADEDKKEAKALLKRALEDFGMWLRSAGIDSRGI
ncbi:MAG: competence/damage-inducible protein A [Desulfovibrionales bacterium]|nr:MAG: competence/damage-inducible protein A [Desulfovibrionales bacterium]